MIQLLAQATQPLLPNWVNLILAIAGGIYILGQASKTIHSFSGFVKKNYESNKKPYSIGLKVASVVVRELFRGVFMIVLAISTRYHSALISLLSWMGIFAATMLLLAVALYENVQQRQSAIDTMVDEIDKLTTKMEESVNGLNESLDAVDTMPVEEIHAAGVASLVVNLRRDFQLNAMRTNRVLIKTAKIQQLSLWAFGDCISTLSWFWFSLWIAFH